MSNELVSLASRINEHHNLAEEHAHKALEHVRQAGQLLSEAKALCKHGEWREWLAANFKGSERSAQRYMKVAASWEELEAKTTRVTDLSLRAALDLLTESQPDAPPEPLSTYHLFGTSSDGQHTWAMLGSHPEEPDRYFLGITYMSEGQDEPSFVDGGPQLAIPPEHLPTLLAVKELPPLTEWTQDDSDEHLRTLYHMLVNGEGDLEKGDSPTPSTSWNTRT